MPWTAQQRLWTSQSCCVCSYGGGCGLANTDRSCPETPPNHDVMHPRRFDIGERFAQIGGADFNLAVAVQELPPLPDVIPVVPDCCRSLIEPLGLRAVAVRLKTVVQALRQPVISPASFRAMVGVPGGSTLVLNCIDNDRRLEDLWLRWPSLAAELPRLGIDAAIAPAYSTWGEDPPLEHVYNAKRSLVAFSLLQQAGTPSIPTIAADWPAQWAAWQHWLVENDAIHTVAIDLGTIRQRARNSDWTMCLLDLRKLLAGIGRPLTVVIAGAAAEARVEEAFSSIKHPLVLATTPIYRAMRGCRLFPKVGGRDAARHRNKPDLARENLDEFETMVTAIKQRRLVGKVAYLDLKQSRSVTPTRKRVENVPRH